MKKHKHLPAFLAGLVTAILLCTCVTTALAVSGTVTFNAVDVDFNAMSFAKKGESLQSDSGTDIPSSIVYTDENGGNTTYVPIRNIAEAFEMPIEWDESTGKVTVHVEGELATYTNPLYSTGWSIDNCIEEVEPIIPQGGTEVLAQVDHQSEEAFTAKVPLESENGRYVSVTVTNHGDKSVEFTFGKYDSESIMRVGNTRIPAGETVTRTIQFISSEDKANFPLYIFVGYSSDTSTSEPINITASAIQFDY